MFQMLNCRIAPRCTCSLVPMTRISCCKSWYLLLNRLLARLLSRRTRIHCGITASCNKGNEWWAWTRRSLVHAVRTHKRLLELKFTPNTSNKLSKKVTIWGEISKFPSDTPLSFESDVLLLREKCALKSNIFEHIFLGMTWNSITDRSARKTSETSLE